jgi:hypothetical protein
MLTMALLTEKSVMPETELKMLSGRFKEYLMRLPVYPSWCTAWVIREFKL